MKQFFVLIVCLSLDIISVAQEGRAFQLWNITSVSHKFSEKTELNISEKIHITPAQEGLDMKFGQILINYKINSWFSMGVGYRLTGTKKLEQWTHEQRPMLLFSANKKVNNFKFILTNRFEYQFFEDNKNRFRDVQRFDIISPTVSNWKMGLFATEEAFYVPAGNFLEMVRLYGGISLFENSKLGFKLYYTYQLKNDKSRWATTDIIGMNLNLSI